MDSHLVASQLFNEGSEQVCSTCCCMDEGSALVLHMLKT